MDVQSALETVDDSLESACTVLWDLDTNRLNPITDYTLNPQSRIEGYRDNADEKLVVSFSDDVWSRPTYASFRRLLDNYTAQTGVPEVVSPDELSEQATFLAAIYDTPCIQFAHQWLLANSHTSAETAEDFQQALHDIWFRLYSRDASRDSSAFEHVFIGELDDGKVKGLHNFYQVYVEEKRANFNYIGYLDPRGAPSSYPPPTTQQFITVRFEWLGQVKPVSSMFVGPSPEFEFALYTMLFLTGTQSVEITLGPYTARIKVYEMDGCIGSAFPELLQVDMDALQAAEELMRNQPVEQDVPDAESFPALGEESVPETQSAWGHTYQSQPEEQQTTNVWGQSDDVVAEEELQENVWVAPEDDAQPEQPVDNAWGVPQEDPQPEEEEQTDQPLKVSEWPQPISAWPQPGE